MAMITQPIESSQIAEATMINPSLRRVKPISRTTAATILIEEIDNAVPRKSEVRRRWSACGSSDSGISWPSAKPQMNGTATPVSEMLSAALPTVRTSLRSVSIPVSSSRRMPNCANGLLLGRARKNGVLQIGPHHSQRRGAQHDAAQQHAHDRRLADAVHELTQQAADQHQRNELHEKDDLGRARLGAFGCESSLCAQRQRGERAQSDAHARRGGKNSRTGHGVRYPAL